MKYKLIAIDMDGTFLNSNHEISDRNTNAVINAMDKGVKVVIATGRGPTTLCDHKEKLKFDTPFIVYNGAGVKYLDKKEYILRFNLDYDVAEKIYNYGNELGVAVLLWVDDKLYANADTKYCDFYKKHTSVEFSIIENFEQFKGCGIHKIMFISEAENIQKIYDDVVEKGFDETNFTISIPTFLEFYSKETSKGQAVLNYARQLGINADEIIAIGDGMNDLTMINMAGLGVAMGNASDIVKKEADFITTTNDDYGVARVIEKFVLDN